MELLQIFSQRKTIRNLIFLAFIVGCSSSQNVTTSRSSPSLPVITNCGVVIRPDPEPLKETPLQIGDWPWLATIYREEYWQIKKICLGTLISPKAILTAGTCVLRGRRILRLNEIVVRLGQTNLTDWNVRTVISPAVKKIILDPEFRLNVAIIELQDNIQLTDFVKPACLWSGGSDLPEGQFGFVARWKSDIAYRTSAKIIHNETCAREYDDPTNFCAGDKNGMDPGSSDKGAGLLIRQNGRWAIRGILPNGFNFDPDDENCDLETYLLYIDIAKVYDWIQANLPNSMSGIDLLQSAAEVCGKTDHKDIEPLKETALTVGEWPWMASLYRRTANILRFSCMGTLITSKTVLTAAPCLVTSFEPTSVEIVVRLGQANYYDVDPTTVITSSIEYYEIHSDSSGEVEDIAILVLTKKIRFTYHIRPACLWSGNINSVEEEYGLIAGWGSDEVRAAIRTSAKILNGTACLGVYPNLDLNTTFCAAERNSLGPCDFSTGGGLLVKRDNIWMIRGTMLAGIECGSMPLDICADAAQMTDWIKTVHSKIKDSDSSLLFTSNKSDDTCGQVNSNFDFTQLAFGGFEIQRGIWPWLVAIYKNRNGDPTYQCGGTLITNKFIMSAAHCFYDRFGELRSDHILVYLGLHELSKKNDTGVISPPIKNISIHQDFNTGREISDADVAIITLSEPIRFTEYIRPACLWASSEISYDQIGYIVGWGRYEDADVSEKPRQVFARIVDTEECFRSNDAFQQIASRRSFCAGNRDLTGPCKGDSGSGLLVESNGRWFVRGIVSTSLSHPLSNICDLREFAVYSDVNKFTDWIRNITNH